MSTTTAQPAAQAIAADESSVIGIDYKTLSGRAVLTPAVADYTAMAA